MKLYKTSYKIIAFDPSDPHTQRHVWEGSADAASKGRTALKAEHNGCKPTTETHDVPTDKTGLLDWLNKHAV